MTGHFITFEGVEGAGKTSVIHRIEKELKARGFNCLTTREPGGISISEQIREIILNPSHTNMDERTEALLYAAARRQHLVEKVMPALQSGSIVLCDRFIDSSLAYQGHARGLGIDEVYEINQFATRGAMPELTLLFDIEPEEGLKRIALNKDREKNRLDLEQLDFHKLVYEGYKIVQKRFKERIQTIDASRSFEEVVQATLAHILTHINK